MRGYSNAAAELLQTGFSIGKGQETVESTCDKLLSVTRDSCMIMTLFTFRRPEFNLYGAHTQTDVDVSNFPLSEYMLLFTF